MIVCPPVLPVVKLPIGELVLPVPTMFDALFVGSFLVLTMLGELPDGFLAMPLTAALGFLSVTFDNSFCVLWLPGETLCRCFPLSGSLVDLGLGLFLSLGELLLAFPFD